MSSVVDAVFRPKPKGPSKSEKEALEEQETLIALQEADETRDRRARSKIITARAAGPQTLFTQGKSIPTKLGGTS